MRRLLPFLIISIPLIAFAVVNSHVVVVHFPVTDFVLFVPLYGLFFLLLIGGVVLASVVQFPRTMTLKRKLGKLEKEHKIRETEKQGESIKESHRKLLESS